MSYISIIFTFFFFIHAVLAINILHIFQAKGSKVKVAGLIIVFATVFTQSSIFWTTDTSFDRNLIKPLETGWPIPFHYEPHPMQEVWEPSSTSGSNFTYSVLINSSLWAAVFFLLANIFRKYGVVAKLLSLRLILLGFISLIVVIIGMNIIGIKLSRLNNPRMNNPVVLPPSFTRPTPSPFPVR
jgi:hypothetical protein